MAEQRTVSLDREINDASTVISILPLQIREMKPGLTPGEFLIPPCKDPYKSCEVLLITRARFPVYIDGDRPALIVPEPSDRVAQSVVRDYKTSISHYEKDVAEPGLFWVPGRLTARMAQDVLSEELVLARKLQDAWFLRLVEAADDDWGRYRMRRMISNIQRLGAKYLGLKKEWNEAMQAESRLSMIQCKFCRADVHPEAIICSHCQGILNPARYDKEFVKPVQK